MSARKPQINFLKTSERACQLTGHPDRQAMSIDSLSWPVELYTGFPSAPIPTVLAGWSSSSFCLAAALKAKIDPAGF
jgi:hypothetical protein